MIWDYVLFQSPICKYGKNGAKKNERYLKVCIEKFSKLVQFGKKNIIEHNFKNI